MAQKQIVTKPSLGSPIGNVDGKPVMASPALQNHFDELTQRLNENLLGTASWIPSYTVATLPASGDLPDPAEAWMAFVTNETGGSVPAFWDGTNWRRVTDRALVT